MLTQDFREFIELLNESKVKYLIVGGYALAAHGIPRYTQDIDFWIRVDANNIEKLLSVLKNFGFDSLDIKKEDFLDKYNIIQLGYPPNRIDLLPEIDGVSFDEAYEHRIAIEIDKLLVNFIGFQQLKQNKQASGRLQDQVDFEQLKKLEEERRKNKQQKK